MSDKQLTKSNVENYNEFGFEMSERQAEFVNVCRRNRYFDCDMVFEDSDADDQFEDDGMYHVRRGGVRVVFMVDPEQCLSESVVERRCQQVASFVAREWDSR